jgi:glycosyltransferase involved in cell wall biosynthesis
MRILQICPKPPWPPVDGGAQAMWHLAEGLRALGHEVSIIALNTNKQFCPPDSVPSDVNDAFRYTLVNADISYRPVPAARHLRSFVPYHVQRFDVAEARKVIDHRMRSESLDLVILESLYASPYLDLIKSMGIPVVVRSHNAEFDIWTKLHRTAHHPLKRWYFGHLARSLEGYEAHVMGQADACACISADDVASFIAHGSKARLYHVPFGMDLSALAAAPNDPPPGPDLYHLGSMDWIPHQEAIRWFVERVWPLVIAQRPGIHCHLGSRTMPAWLMELKLPGLHVQAGNIDALAFMHDKGILVAPSFSGSGVMVKVVEAMARGKAIITTTNGARGLGVTSGRHMLISDSPEEWAADIIRLSTNAAERVALQANALAFARKEHDRIQAAQRLLDGWRAFQ